MAVSIDSFLKHVLPQVPGCPESLATDAIRNACIRFCTDTYIVRENIPASDVLIGVEDYTITASTNNEVVGMVSFVYDGTELPMKTEEEADIDDHGWRTTDPGVATYVMAPEPDRILLNREPVETITDGMIVRIATRPTDTTTLVNNLLLQDWKHAIKYGALEELLEMPDKGWSNIKSSLYYGGKFNFEIQRGKARATMGNHRKSTVAKSHAWV